MNRSSIQCNLTSGKESAVERFNGIKLDEINCLLDNPSIIESEPNSNLAYFLRSVSKGLPFSDDTVKHDLAISFFHANHSQRTTKLHIHDRPVQSNLGISFFHANHSRSSTSFQITVDLSNQTSPFPFPKDFVSGLFLYSIDGPV